MLKIWGTAVPQNEVKDIYRSVSYKFKPADISDRNKQKGEKFAKMYLEQCEAKSAISIGTALLSTQPVMIIAEPLVAAKAGPPAQAGENPGRANQAELHSPSR